MTVTKQIHRPAVAAPTAGRRALLRSKQVKFERHCVRRLWVKVKPPLGLTYSPRNRAAAHFASSACGPASSVRPSTPAASAMIPAERAR